jgi:hypothetical protein
LKFMTVKTQDVFIPDAPKAEEPAETLPEAETEITPAAAEEASE